MNARGWTILVIIVVLVGAVVLYWTKDHRGEIGNRSEVPQSVQAVFNCADGKSIDATFTNGEPLPPEEEGGPPRPTGSVLLRLSDGRELELPQTISASGIRYANADESFVFWNKGNSAFIAENGTNTYDGCEARS